MGQIVCRGAAEGSDKLELPDPCEQVMPGVPWGRVDELFTPAYWVSQVWLAKESLENLDHKLGKTLREEVAACLLAGYGMPSEIGIAAFRELRLRSLLADDASPSQDEILMVLSKPLCLGNRFVRYRFAKQKSIYLSEFLKKSSEIDPPVNDDRKFRIWLLQFRGIGLKIASWITRNWLGSDKVAILDIHIRRAGIVAGLFSPGHSVGKDYFLMENRYLEFAQRLSVRPSVLDSLIWSHMRRAIHIGLRFA